MDNKSSIMIGYITIALIIIMLLSLIGAEVVELGVSVIIHIIFLVVLWGVVVFLSWFRNNRKAVEKNGRYKNKDYKNFSRSKFKRDKDDDS